MTTVETFTIGQLAAKAEVSVETIRYYQRRGLIKTPPRPQDGFRVYTNDHYARLTFIRKAQRLGFTLSEISQVLSFSDDDCPEVKALAENKLSAINSKIEDLNRLKSVLTTLIDACNEKKEYQPCPIIESLVTEER